MTATFHLAKLVQSKVRGESLTATLAPGMSTKKKDTLATSPEWARHLRKEGKREYWHRERNAEKKEIADQVEELEDSESDSTKLSDD